MWCGIKFGPRHICIRSQLYHLLVKDTEVMEEELEEFLDCVETIEEILPKVNEGGVHGISLHAL